MKNIFLLFILIVISILMTSCSCHIIKNENINKRCMIYEQRMEIVCD